MVERCWKMKIPPCRGESIVSRSVTTLPYFVFGLVAWHFGKFNVWLSGGFRENLGRLWLHSTKNPAEVNASSPKPVDECGFEIWIWYFSWMSCVWVSRRLTWRAQAVSTNNKIPLCTKFKMNTSNRPTLPRNTPHKPCSQCLQEGEWPREHGIPPSLRRVPTWRTALIDCLILLIPVGSACCWKPGTIVNHLLYLHLVMVWANHKNQACNHDGKNKTKKIWAFAPYLSKNPSTGPVQQFLPHVPQGVVQRFKVLTLIFDGFPRMILDWHHVGQPFLVARCNLFAKTEWPMSFTMLPNDFLAA